jgi:LacI family transcriptional regulator
VATIRDVAASAGVGTATVSRVLNGYAGVRPATRDRVLQAARVLNYRANGVAKALATGKFRTAGLILPDVSNPFFPSLARGVEDAAHADGYAVIFGNADNVPEREAEYVGLLRDRLVDGMIIASTGAPAALAELVGDVPVVLLDRRVPGWRVSYVSTDHRLGARLAVQHLVARGHQRIAHLGGPEHVASAEDRLGGYREALLEAGIDPRAEWIARGPFSYESGYERMLHWIDSGLEISAVFAADDLIAIGALQACQDRGWAVPQRLALVGFDDTLLARLVRPRLTTVLQPAYQIGVQAWELLARHMADPGAPTSDVVVEPHLVIREST